MEKIYNSDCKLTIIRKERYFEINVVRKVQFDVEAIGYKHQCDSQESSKDINYYAWINLQDFLELSDIDFLSNVIEDLRIKLDTLDQINGFFNFLYNNCECWHEIEERLKQLVQDAYNDYCKSYLASIGE